MPVRRPGVLCWLGRPSRPRAYQLSSTALHAPPSRSVTTTPPSRGARVPAAWAEVAWQSGIAIGEVRHSFRARDGGTHYRVDAIIGADLPLFGSLLNLYLRKRVFHPAMMSQWQRHQIEEVASLQFFLPQLYAQREMGNHFILHTTP